MDFSIPQRSFVQNVEEFPAILQVLADKLAVTPQSLSRLGVGYAPVVEFKKGTNTNGWWSTPERDADGEITGLTLRGLHDGSMKPMYLKSKHGLIYPVRSDFDPETSGYEHGAHNWVRTADAGLACPLCDKPDGCLLAADDPEDPKAVICIRVKDGCESTTKLGWRHVLKPEGHVSRGGPLPDSPFPIVLVEGMSDTATALDLGFVAIGRGSALFTTGLRGLCQGRDVIVVGENDAPDKFGRVAGVEGLNAVSEVLQDHAASVTKVLPPEGCKDLRRWKAKHNLTTDSFLTYVGEYGAKLDASDLLPSADPLPVAGMWLRDSYWDDRHDLPVLRRYGGIWYVYDGVKYVEHKDELFLRGEFYRWLNGKRYMKNEDELALYVPTRSRVSDLLDALNAFCPVIETPPAWLGGEKSDPRNTAVFDNGVLHVDRYVAGEENYLTPLTPAFFTLNALPYPFDPDATCPLWDSYLDSTFGRDPKGQEKIDLLQEWFGYCMVADMSLEKMLIMIGPSGSGKGTALAAFTALLGKHQVAATKMKSIGEQFGIEPLIGSLAAVMSDMRIPRSADPTQALETILQITGGDTIDVPRKYRTNLAAVNLSTRLVVASNELPELPDHSQALARRLAIVHFNKSFVGREDSTLKERLPQEAAGIAVWALDGLRRLRAEGQFTVPSTAEAVMADFRNVTSPVSEFVEDCCVVDETSHVAYLDIFEIWCGWASSRGMRPGHRTRFKQRLEVVCPGVHMIKVGTRQMFKGVEVDTVAKRRYG